MSFLYNLRFFLACLHPSGWRSMTDTLLAVWNLHWWIGFVAGALLITARIERNLR